MGASRDRSRWHDDVDVSGSKASYKRGVLTIVLPLAKKPTVPERVTIQIRSGR